MKNMSFDRNTHVSRTRGLMVLLALGAACSAGAADTWYWLGATQVNESGATLQYGYPVQATANWKNAATGLNGIPKNGDIVVFDSAYSGSAHEIGQDSGNIQFGGFIYNRSCGCNQGNVTFLAGGPGVKLNGNFGSYWNSECSLKGTGEVEFYVSGANQSLSIQKNLRGDAGTVLVKTGPGMINVFCNGWYSRTYSVPKTLLKEGTFRINVYEGNPSVGHEFWFDTDNPSLRIHLGYKRDGASDYGPERYNWVIKDGAIYENAVVANHTHDIYSSQTNYIAFTGTPKANPMTFTGRFTGNAGLKWAPSVDSSFVLSGGVSSSTGFFVVSNGTVRVADGAYFSGAAQITVDGTNSKFDIAATAGDDFSNVSFALTNGGRIIAGLNAILGAVTVNGVAVANGLYKAVGAVGDGTEASWVEGTGTVLVGSIVEPAAVAVTWDGAGADANATTLANWNGATALPDLTNGSAQIDVTGGSAFTADVDAWVKGFTLSKQHFGISAASGRSLQLGSGGIVNTSNGNVSVGGAGTVTLVAPQTWDLKNGNLTIAGPIANYGACPQWIKGNGGQMNVNVATPEWKNELFITNMTVNVKVSGALGPSSARPVHFFKTPSFTPGITFDRDWWVYVTPTITTTAGSNLTFNGFCCSTNGQGMNISAPAGSKIVFNKLMMSRNGGTMKGAGTIVFNDSCHFRDRPSMSGTVTVELHKDGNRLNGNMGTFEGGTLKAMAPYVITKANTIRQANDGGGGSKDGTQNTMINSKSAFTLDLNGFDQSIDIIAMHADGNNSGGHVTSATPATLHMQTASAYWPQHNYSYGFGNGFKSISTADNYGYETSDKGSWEGLVSLSYEAATGKVRSMMRTSSSSGTVEVVSGKLVFLRRAATSGETFDLKGGSSNPYPRLANEDGAWPNATEARVKGGVLKLEHSAVFGRQVNVAFTGTTGKMELDAGVVQKCCDLTFDGVKQARGTWGATGSGARHVDDTHFAGTGVLNVLGDGQGVVLIFR